MNVLEHPPAALRCCPGVARMLVHHLGNAGMGGGGFVALLLRDAEISAEVRAELECVRDAWTRVTEVNRAIVADPALCAAGRTECEGDACTRPGPGHHERLINDVVRIHLPDDADWLALADRLHQILASDRVARKKEEEQAA